jgi:hypothetical protein
MKMDATTLKALRQSIAHWKRLATGKRKDDEGIYIEDCALCNKFFKNVDCASDCLGCPVRNETGFSHCTGTPWKRVRESLYRDGILSGKFRAEAREMLSFLQSLLPKNKKK